MSDGRGVTVSILKKCSSRYKRKIGNTTVKRQLLCRERRQAILCHKYCDAHEFCVLQYFEKWKHGRSLSKLSLFSSIFLDIDVITSAVTVDLKLRRHSSIGPVFRATPWKSGDWSFSGNQKRFMQIGSRMGKNDSTMNIFKVMCIISKNEGNGW